MNNRGKQAHNARKRFQQAKRMLCDQDKGTDTAGGNYFAEANSASAENIVHAQDKGGSESSSLVQQRCRSVAGSSEVSSTIVRPKTHRLVKVIASNLADRIACSLRVTESSMITEGVFTHVDASGGGTRLDVAKLLTNLITAMKLGESETGRILIGVNHVLRPDDVILAPETWRPLLVTALLVALKIVYGEDAKPQERLLASVVHWWPATKARTAYDVFVAREAFVSVSKFHDDYFALREEGLLMPDDNDFSSSNASAVRSVFRSRENVRPEVSASELSWTYSQSEASDSAGNAEAQKWRSRLSSSSREGEGSRGAGQMRALISL